MFITWLDACYALLTPLLYSLFPIQNGKIFGIPEPCKQLSRKFSCGRGGMDDNKDKVVIQRSDPLPNIEGLYVFVLINIDCRMGIYREARVLPRRPGQSQKVSSKCLEMWSLYWT